MNTAGGAPGGGGRPEPEVRRCPGDADQLFAEHGPPAYIRSDNGPKRTSKVVRGWPPELGVKPRFIEPGSPWENGYNESFNGTLGEEVLEREIFFTLKEAKVLIKQWRRE